MSDYNDPYDALGLSEENINVTDEVEHSISAGVDTQEASMESFMETRSRLVGTDHSTDDSSMGGITITTQRPPQIRILSNDGSSYRVYMRSDIQFQPKDINNLCRFLDTRTPNQVVYFMLGMDICVEQSALIGPIVSAIMTCKARTVGMAMGLCSLPETMIWSYCSDRQVLRYGAICYSRPEFIKECPQYESYYREAFAKGVELNVITKEEVEEVFTKNKEIVKFYTDFK
jgi:hypothetical protein